MKCARERIWSVGKCRQGRDDGGGSVLVVAFPHPVTGRGSQGRMTDRMGASVHSTLQVLVMVEERKKERGVYGSMFFEAQTTILLAEQTLSRYWRIFFFFFFMLPSFTHLGDSFFFHFFCLHKYTGFRFPVFGAGLFPCFLLHNLMGFDTKSKVV